MTLYIGIDPGRHGAIAFIDTTAREVQIETTPIVNMTERDLWEYLTNMVNSSIEPKTEQVKAVIEKVQGYIGESQPGSAAFVFGQSYGALRMALVAASVPFEEVTPQVWQRGLGVSPRKKTEAKHQYKNRLKALAQQLFPSKRIILATCDALLMAEYCRRLHRGMLGTQMVEVKREIRRG